MREPVLSRQIMGWLVATAMLFTVAPSSAQDSQGWHVVRPGDTLEGITSRYLGAARDWRNNWKLNPHVRDPDLLLPGDRLRVLLRPVASQPAAQLRNVRRAVDEMPVPIPWKPAADEDLLIVHDGVRTDHTASAELAFTDGTAMRLDENSLLFLRGAKAQRDPGDVEIVRGQTDVEVIPGRSPAAEVELVLGPARARARAGEGSPGRVRARRPESGAQVMVYAGSGDVSAAGSRVELPAGTGSAVPEQGPPSPPEALLAAPAPARPAAGAALSVDSPIFDWAAVAGARAYLLELCADSRCSDVLRREIADQPQQMIRGLAPGSYFWRITARSASGLDGFPSAAVSFSLAPGGGEVTPASPKLALTGALVTRAGVRYVPAIVPLAVESSGGGSDRLETVVNGKVIAEPELKRPWKGGAYEAFVRVRDVAGHPAASPVVAFTVDDAPPAIEWQVAMPSMLREHGAPMPLVGKVLRDASRAARRDDARLSLTADGGNWRAVGPGDTGALWHALSQEPQVFLLAVEDRPFGSGAPQMEGGQLVRIRATDSGSGVERLEVGVRQAADGTREMEIVARDRVGNAASTAWSLQAD